MRSILLPSLILIALGLSSCADIEPAPSGVSDKSSEAKGEYMGMAPTEEPRLLAPSLIGSSLDEYNGTFSPEGDAFYFTTNTPTSGIICCTFMDDNGDWEEVSVAAFSGEHSEYDPLFSPDGQRLYFSSERPVQKDSLGGDAQIWYIERLDSSWSSPMHLDLGEEGCYYSSITASGDIYYNRWNTGDMYKAKREGEVYTSELLPPALNTSNGEGDPFISPMEDYMIFRGYENSMGAGDLYISYLIDGVWTEAENLGEPINSSRHEMCPYVTADGQYFIFASSRMASPYESGAKEELDVIRKKHQSFDNGQLNIYYISADFITEGRKKYQGSIAEES